MNVIKMHMPARLLSNVLILKHYDHENGARDENKVSFHIVALDLSGGFCVSSFYLTLINDVRVHMPLKVVQTPLPSPKSIAINYFNYLI